MTEEEKELIARWPSSFAECSRCTKVHETFVDCGAPTPCGLCRDLGGFEWNRHAECWEPAECPECGAAPADDAEPPKERLR